MSGSTISFEADAHHEAGHAVLAVLCSHRLIHVNMMPNHAKGWAASIRHAESEAELQSLLFPEFMIEDSGAPMNEANLDDFVHSMNSNEKSRFELLTQMDQFSVAESYVLLAAAGGLCHERYEPTSFDPRTCDYDWEDAYESLEIAAIQNKHSIDFTKSRLIDEAARILERPDVWGAVIALAKELRPDRKMSGETATEIIASSLVQEAG